MLRFNSDYMEGAHPEILARLTEMNFDKQIGYGKDEICEEAKRRVLSACGCPEGEAWFLVGGTQTNATVIDALLRPYQSVIAAQCGHINAHESGAIEAAGHKIVGLPHESGILDAEVLRAYLTAFYADPTYDHQPIPGMVYISHPSEYGTIYTKAGLEALSAVCREFGLYLFMDGARMGYGLTAAGADLTLSDIAACCDAFYIGGTKVGALFGEAVVFPKKDTCRHFFTTIKQHGALLAKGWLLGVQFDTLFTDDLYLKIAANAIEKAMKLREMFCRHGYRLYADSPTNQQFFVISRARYTELRRHVSFELIDPLPGDEVVVRFVTSWATTDEQLDELEALL
ncbi:MAG: hypothetical protein E7458_07805 [Ruminococcaceae bacterium]|nr:hypothetical protein [Oscillospiraceae bacterium]